MAKSDRTKPEDKDDVLQAVEATEPVVQPEPGENQPEAAASPATPDDTVPDGASATEPPREEADGTETPAAPTSEPKADTPPAPNWLTPEPPAAKQGNGFLGMFIGGAVAVAVGFGAATLMMQTQTAGFESRLAAQEAAVANIAGRLTALEEAPAAAPVDTTLADRLTAVESKLSEAPAAPDLTPVTESVAALEARLAAIESMPIGEGGGISPAITSTLETLKDEVQALKGAGNAASSELAALADQTRARIAEAEEMAMQLKADAEKSSRLALAEAAIVRLTSALESGSPFAAALSSIEGPAIPDVLTANAAKGIPTAADLVSSFPDAARAALDASLRANAGESWSERVGSFLQSTTGARSLEPREGTDPDAVLSRAEAAARADDLSLALTELQGLPPQGQAAMADWIAKAQTRIDATKAVADLAAALEG